jgi:hypothetical protein
LADWSRASAADQAFNTSAESMTTPVNPGTLDSHMSAIGEVDAAGRQAESAARIPLA